MRALAQCPDGTPPPCRAVVTARVSIDSNAVAIFPFRLSGSSATDAAWLREGAVDLLNLALDDAGGWRVINPRTLLSRTRAFTDATPESEAARVARSVGAGQMILGSAVVIGPQVRAQATLYDLAGTRQLASVEARGALSDPTPVIDSLAAGLARARLVATGGSPRRVQEFATTSPRALRAFLAAERIGRTGRYQEAADSLRSAIAADSSFGVAYYRLRIAGTYGANIGVGQGEAIAVALRFRDRLPQRQRDLLDLVWATATGDVRAALSFADQVGARYPDDPEVAYEEGEAYYHLGLAFGERPARARQAFDRAIGLDSSFIDPYGHAAELRFVLGDTAGALAVARRGAERGPTSVVHQATYAAARAIIRGESPAAVARQLPTGLGLSAEGTDVLGRAAFECWRMLMNDPGRALVLGDAFLVQAMSGNGSQTSRRAAAQSRIFGLAAAGRYREAWTLLDTLRLMGESDALPTIGTELILLSGDTARPVTPISLAAAPPEALGAAGLLALRSGRVARIDSILRALDAYPGEVLHRYGVSEAAALRALVALSRGDTVATLQSLNASRGIFPYGASGASTILRFTSVQQWASLALARLDLAAGDLASADRALDLGTFANGAVPLRAPMEEVRAQVAERRGDVPAARAAYGRLISIWRNADPELQPRVAAAQAALTRLGTH